MKHFFLIIILSLGLIGCSHNLPPQGSKAKVQSEIPRTEQVDHSLDKTKVLVRNSQELIDQVSQLSLDNKSLIDQIKAQNTTPANNPVIDKLTTGLAQTTAELFKIKVELREAYDELEKNKANVAVLQSKIDDQTKELVYRTEKYNQEVANEELIRLELAKQKEKAIQEHLRGNMWRKYFWWVFAVLFVWLALKVLKAYTKLSVPFI